MKFNTRFYISWIFAAILMYALFYTWHGVFLNDFKKINFPITWLIVFTSVAYITISFVLYLVFESKPLKNIYSFFVRGIVSGAVTGAIIFMVSIVVTISISKSLSPKHLMLDFTWQMIEQIIGGLLLATIKVFVPDHAHERI
ncbi:MAG: hypothetical protein AB7O73_08665 [Bacteroidia bacterium]